MDKQQFIDTHLTDYLKQFPDATDAELDDITSSSARTFDLQQKPQEYSAIPTMDTTKGFAENVAKDAPVLLGKVAEGGGDFAATAMQGTKKAVETLLSPLDTEAEAEAKRQATDVAYGSIKNALGEGVRNIQKYYQGEAPEFEPTAGVEPKSELYPADYNERLTKAKEKQGQPKPEAPGIFEQIPGGREVRESVKAIPQFIGQSAADVGSLAGNLYEGDPETVQQFYEKPLTTAGMPALGVAIPLSLGYRKTIGKKTEGKPALAELTPEEAQYKAKFDAELQKAQLENAVETKAPIAERPMNTEQNFEDALAADIYKKQPQLNPKVQEEIANAGIEPLEDTRGLQRPIDKLFQKKETTEPTKDSVLKDYSEITGDTNAEIIAFGSREKGTAKPESDFDFIIKPSDKIKYSNAIEHTKAITPILSELKKKYPNADIQITKDDGYIDMLKESVKLSQDNQQATTDFVTGKTDVKPTIETPTAKEPWQMTKEEFDSEAWFRGQKDNTRNNTGFWTTKPGEAEIYAKNYSETGGKPQILMATNKDFAPETFEYYDVELPKRYKNAAEYRTENEHIPGARANNFVQIPVDRVKEAHKFIIEQALSEGKPVPTEVLAEYPDLKQKPVNKLFQKGKKQTPKIGSFGAGTLQNIYEKAEPQIKKAYESVKKFLEEGKPQYNDPLLIKKDSETRSVYTDLFNLLEGKDKVLSGNTQEKVFNFMTDSESARRYNRAYPKEAEHTLKLAEILDGIINQPITDMKDLITRSKNLESFVNKNVVGGKLSMSKYPMFTEWLNDLQKNNRKYGDADIDYTEMAKSFIVEKAINQSLLDLMTADVSMAKQLKEKTGYNVQPSLLGNKYAGFGLENVGATFDPYFLGRWAHTNLGEAIKFVESKYNSRFKDVENKPTTPISRMLEKGKEFLGNEEGSLSVGPIVDSLTSGYEAGRQKLFEARKKMSELGNPIDNALTYFFEKYHPILKTLKGEEKVKGLETIDQKRNADNFIKQFLKDSGLAESVAKDLSGAGLNLDHLGAYAEARRTLYERDPRGIASRLDKQKAIDSLNEYNPKQQAALQKAFTDIQSEWQKTIIPNLIGSEVFDPKINPYIQRNDNYSRNVVVEKALESVLQQGDAHSQKLMQHLSEFGSKKEILNPVEQMILYARTLNQFTSREVMKRNLIDMVAKNGEVSDVPKDGYAPVKYQHNGEWVEKYLPKDMAYALNEHPVEASTAGKFFDWLAFGNPVSKAMTRQIILNPAFIAGNSLMLDPITTWAQLPSWQSKLGYPLVHILTLAEKAGSTKAGQLAKYFGIDDLKATQEKMTKNKVYNIGSLYDRSMSGETQLEGIMEGIGLNQNVVEFFTGKKSKIAKAAGAFENMASKIDNSSKESLYRYLNAFEGYRGQEKINQMTREMGTPATKRSGEGEALLRRGTMFGNAVLQAGRATAKNFVDNPVQFAFSNIGVPTALAYGAYQWMKSDPEMKKRWDSLSEYQKKNFINIYTGEGKEGKPLFFSLPLPRMARIAYGVMIDLMETDKTFAEHAGNVVKGLAQGALSELPGALSQPLNLAGDVISYARGKAPYDYYRGQEVIPQKVMDADETLYKRIFGDKQMNNLATDKAFASYLLNTYATGGWFKLDSMKNVPEGFEWTKIAPMNRIFRMGGSGVASKLYKAKDEGKKLEARASLIIEDAVKKSVKEGKNIEVTPELQEAIQFLPSALKNQMIKASIKNIKEETGDPNIDLITALQGATSMQKMLIIKKFQEMFPNAK